MRTEDGKIIRRCLDGESEAFGLLVDKYKASIFALVCAKVRNFHDAEDITQEVFTQAYSDLKSLRNQDNFLWWLYSIAYNRCKDWFRKQSRRPDSIFIENQDELEKIMEVPSMDSYHADLVSESLHDALDSLPKTYREVLTLYYLGGMDSVEIAQALGTSPTAIRQQLSRARTQLKGEVLSMMSDTFQQNRLQAGFTFKIVEAVKRIKINPISTIKGLPWGLSLATGIMIAIMSLNPYINWFSQIGAYVSSVLPSETKVLKVGEIPVDVVKTSSMITLADKMGKGKSGELKPDMENALFMSPQGEGGTWTNKANMPTTRVNLSSSEVDGIIYAIGGWNGSTFFSTVEAYDPKRDIWTRKTDMPTARMGLSTSVVDGIIYAIGGWIWPVGPGTLTTVEAYNPKTDTWTKKADMPTARDWLCTSVVDGIIYAIGGWNNTALSTVEAYDPVTDTWTQKKDMPTLRYCFSTGVVNGIIYAIGGQKDIGQGMAINFATVEAYDPKIDTWTKKKDMPTERMELKASVVDGEIYAIGGWIGEDAQICSTVEKYNPVTDTWTMKSEMSTNRGFHSNSVVNGKIYAIGGGTAWNLPLAEGIVEEYTPEGWFSVSSNGKLPTTWGSRKSNK
jgi:RNA polymerase sigma factor (sigma-70 family)